ncbi:MAG: putative metalloprotease CJM1_0395 family protein [Thalassobaculaceae bacterium]|nr:putative metalloprotease CJM1_0395 family protein [Thalassobaculaceae bacterium]
MTTTAPLLPPGTGSFSPAGPPSGGRRPSIDDDTARETGRGTQQGSGPGTDRATERDTTLPGRAPRGDSQAQAQSEAPPLRPGRPLIGGGPFTLAVAFGLQAAQAQETVTAATASSPAQAAQIEEQAAAEGETGAGATELSEEEQKVVSELQQRDQEVRRHEAAHAAAGGQHAGAPKFSYQQGPDGRQYAIGGSVSIDTSPVKGDPEATLQKARQVRAAALAPADPSGQDKSVAAAASALERQAQAEISAERRAEQSGEAEGTPGAESQTPESETVETTPSIGAASGEGGVVGAGQQGGAVQAQGPGAFTATGTDKAAQAGASDAFDPRQSSSSDQSRLVPPRPSTGFDGRTPAPQIISLSV